MSFKRQQKAVIYRRNVTLFNQRRNSKLSDELTLAEMIELIDLIPDALIGMDSLKYASSINLSIGFTNIEDYLKWLSDLSDIIYHEKYFNKEILSVLSDSRTLLLSEFLIDSNEMVNHPVTVLQETRRTIMKIQQSLSAIKDAELLDYYNERMRMRFNLQIALPIIALAELAGAY